jgi:hypothetical protein
MIAEANGLTGSFDQYLSAKVAVFANDNLVVVSEDFDRATEFRLFSDGKKIPLSLPYENSAG